MPDGAVPAARRTSGCSISELVLGSKRGANDRRWSAVPGDARRMKQLIRLLVATVSYRLGRSVAGYLQLASPNISRRQVSGTLAAGCRVSIRSGRLQVTSRPALPRVRACPSRSAGRGTGITAARRPRPRQHSRLGPRRHRRALRREPLNRSVHDHGLSVRTVGEPSGANRAWRSYRIGRRGHRGHRNRIIAWLARCARPPGRGSQVTCSRGLRRLGRPIPVPVPGHEGQRLR